MSDDVLKLPSIDLLGSQAPRKLSDAVHQILREAITSGTLAPGDRLREVAIARQLSVSPTPVREALRRLEREGLVESTSHRGAAVAAVTSSIMANLYELHETLEAAAVRLAVLRGPHNLDHIRALLDRIDDSLSLPDHSTFNRLDLQFHRAVNELSGNREMAELAEQTHRRIQAARVRLDIHLPNRPTTSQKQHRQLLDTIVRGDHVEAERLARIHINTTREPVLRLMKELPAHNKED